MSEDLKKLHAYYHEGDNQFRLAGGMEGIRKLVNDFYDLMETLPAARRILFMHPKDLTEARDKLAHFLCVYFNGSEQYEEKYGKIRLGPAHAHLAIGTAEKEAWLLCMERAIEKQPWPREFKDFVWMRLQTPAERVRNRP